MIQGMTEYRTWLADPATAAERRAYFAAPQQPRGEWPVDTLELVERHREIGTQQLRWAVDSFRKADALGATQ